MYRFGEGVSNQKKGYKIRRRFPPRASAGELKVSRKGGEAMLGGLGGKARATPPKKEEGVRAVFDQEEERSYWSWQILSIAMVKPTTRRRST